MKKLIQVAIFLTIIITNAFAADGYLDFLMGCAESIVYKSPDSPTDIVRCKTCLKEYELQDGKCLSIAPTDPNQVWEGCNGGLTVGDKGFQAACELCRRPARGSAGYICETIKLPPEVSPSRCTTGSIFGPNGTCEPVQCSDPGCMTCPNGICLSCKPGFEMRGGRCTIPKDIANFSR